MAPIVRFILPATTATTEATRARGATGRSALWSWVGRIQQRHAPLGPQPLDLVQVFSNPRAPAFCDLSDRAVAPERTDSVVHARTSGIMRFPTPHDHGGSPYLPAHHPRSAGPGPAA